jgi:DNA-directed RNA polymerase specialized sigma24 family protein
MRRRRRGANDPTSPRMLRAMKREARAIEMRLEGATYEEISEKLGITNEGARSCVLRVLERTLKELVRGVDGDDIR